MVRVLNAKGAPPADEITEQLGPRCRRVATVTETGKSSAKTEHNSTLGRCPELSVDTITGMLEQLELADTVRRQVAPRIAKGRKSELGQFMTPSNTARFMASLFPASTLKTCRLLDAGAGVGALSCAFLDRWISGGFQFQDVQAYAYEIDDRLRGHLTQHLAAYDGVTAHVSAEDFISSSNQLLFHGATDYTHAILNPPYKKINSQSPHRHELRALGIETVNLYSAFVALAVLLVLIRLLQNMMLQVG